MQIINISGKAEHGKDTLALMLKDKLSKSGKQSLILHYGDYLKFLCKVLYNWDGQKNEEGRMLLQQFGTNKVRDIIPDYWVISVANQLDLLEYLDEEPDFVLIPDCRFPNEIEWWAKNGFQQKSVRVIRNNHISKLTAEQLQHPSEIALDEYQHFDFVVQAQDMEGLEVVAERLTQELLGDIIL